MSIRLLESTVAGLPMPAFFVEGATERITACNPPAEGMFGRAAVGRHYITVLRQPAMLDCVETVLRTFAPAEGLYVTTEGSRETAYRVTAAPVAGETVEGVLLVLQDISHMHDSVQIRRDFVANVSHELKTPLTALMGFIETLQGPARNDPDAQTRFLGIMEREAKRMIRLVQDLLSLSRVESEERVRPADEVRLGPLLRSVHQNLAPVAQEAGATLSLVGCEAETPVPGDTDQLMQVFTNLVENAIKYGGPQVTVTLTDSDRDPALRGPAVRVTVQDDGEGIDSVHLPRLTERFYRVDSHRSREMGGTGLGLAIVKHIVNRHRGRLRIESEPAGGSRFSIVLPRE